MPGNFLGDYQVDAVLLESTCGAGPLTAPNIWEFEIKLSRDNRHLYWSNGAEAIRGDLASDGRTFGFTTEIASTLREFKSGRPGCVIWRQDSINGKLELEEESDDVPSFRGKLTYSYATGANSFCDEVLDESGLTQLPCVIRYEIVGSRIDDE